MKPRNGGDGLSGRVQNSGWAWRPTMNGWSVGIDGQHNEHALKTPQEDASNSPCSSATCIRSPRSSRPRKNNPFSSIRWT